MKARPFSLLFFPALLGAIALAFPIQLAAYYEVLLKHPAVSVSAHAFFTYGLVTFTLINAFWIYDASPAVKWSLPLLSLAISTYYYYLYHLGVIHNPGVVAGVFTASLGINFFFLDEKSKFLLGHPHLRWWRVPPRKQIKVPAFVSPFRGEGFACETFDLSPEGAFIPFNCSSTRKSLRQQTGTTLQNGEFLFLRLTLGSFRTVRLKARVVRLAEKNQGVYPSGFAVRFNDVDRETKKHLQQFLNGN